MIGQSKYEKICLIGQGTYCSVYKAKDLRDDSIVSLKIRKYTLPNELETINREVSILKELNHPNVVKLHDVEQDDTKFALVLDFFPIDLASYIKTHQIQPNLLKSYAYQLLSGLNYLHSKGVIHRDINPSNVLLDENGFLKIGGFSLAKFSPPQASTPDLVTAYYRPPEIFLGSTSYANSVDIWSAGCVLAEMILRKPLFIGDNDTEILHKIFDIIGTPNEETMLMFKQLPRYKDKPQDLANILHGADAQILDLISKMLQIDPSKRITAKDALSHPYFNDLQQKIKDACAA
ncbi:CMGC family protein kinase [Histomonas meleagridis]|uniref:CMGC family protein kinase n=1 Tax=Histomonas meleagridis TaxID=135588 RepID=UPI00355A1773|nr:CMGC family protein kinase [Histomonas meleagridis]KAH0802923.1 CMGC family protein kinase [Histomonas meleagridis]